ncbi:MAG: hypothetical protein MUQ10_14800 [Anaerolineae bacterium]|nr:hypothetical protein [Anaerolineae bacterium]
MGGGDGSEIPLTLSNWVSQHLQAIDNALILELPFIRPDVVVLVARAQAHTFSHSLIRSFLHSLTPSLPEPPRIRRQG